jgi:hypothetical protein
MYKATVLLTYIFPTLSSKIDELYVSEPQYAHE